MVRPGEIGAIDDIREAARGYGLGARVSTSTASSAAVGAARTSSGCCDCSGSSREDPSPGTAMFVLDGVDAPSPMEDRLRSLLTQGYGARLAADYCWRWSDPIKGGGLVEDIRVPVLSHSSHREPVKKGDLADFGWKYLPKGETTASWLSG